MSEREQFHAPAHPNVEREVNDLLAAIEERGWDLHVAEIDLEHPEYPGSHVANKQIVIELDLAYVLDNHD